MIFYELNKQQKVVGIVSSAIVEATLEEAINTAGKLKFTTISKLRDDCYYILFKRPSAETYMCFKILTETQNNTQVEYTAVESAYDELASYSYIKDIRPQNHSAKEMLTQILSVTRYQVGYVADTPGKTTNFYYKSVLESLQELTNLFGLEITFDVVFDANDNQIKRRLVNLYHQQGNRTGKRFEYGDKLLSVTKEQSSEELVTALVGRGSSVQVSEGSDGSPDGYSRKITFADIEWKKASGNPLDKPLGQEFLEDPSATALYGFSDGKPRIGIVEFSNIKDKNELIQATYEKLQELKRTKVSFKAAVTDVGDLALGDTVAIIRHDLQIEYLTRVYKVTHNLLNEQDNTVEFGDSFQSASITNKLSNIQQDVQSARERSELAVQAANEKNTNFYSSSKPSSAIEGDLWYKDLGNGETELYAWHNGNWELVVSTADTTAVKRQVEQAQADAEVLSSEVESAKKQAQEAFAKAGFNADEIDNIKTTTSEVTETLTSTVRQTSELSENLKNVASETASQYSTVSSELSGARNSLTAKASELAKEVASNSANITKANSQLYSQSEGLAKVSQSATKMEQTMTDLSGRVHTVETTASETKEALADTKGNITTLTKRADGTDTKIADAQGRVQTLESRAGKWEQDISKKVDTSTYTAGIQNLGDKLSLKANKTDLDGYATTAQLNVEHNRITQQAGDIITVKNLANAANSKIDGLRIGSRNLLKGTSDQFKTITAWGWMNAHTYSNYPYVDLSNYHTGDYLTYSVWVTNTSDVPIRAEIYCFDKNKGYTHAVTDYNGVVNPGNSGWLVITTQIESNDWYARPSIITTSGQTGSHTIRMREEMLTLGNVKLPWQPSDLDLPDTIVSTVTTTTNAKQIVDKSGIYSEVAKLVDTKVGGVTTQLDSYKHTVDDTGKKLKDVMGALKLDSNGNLTSNFNELIKTASGVRETYNELSGKINGIVVGGKNLLDNSDSQLVMGYGIDNTTWTNGKSTLVYNHDYSKTNKSPEILPQTGSRNQWYRVNKDEELTQSIIVETDATYDPNGVYQFSWFTDEFGHRLITANIDVLGTNKYRLWCSFKWDKDQSCNMRIMNIKGLTKVLRIDNSGTYISFYHPQIERGNKPSDWGMSDNDINKKISDANISIAKTNETIKTVDGTVATVKNNLDKTKSIVTQLSNLFGVNVGDSSISVTNGGVLVKGKQIHIDGQTLIDNASIDGAKIKSLDAGKITTGTLNAAAVKVINLDASKITTGTLTGPSLKLDLKTGEVLFSKGRITGPGLDMDLSTGTINFNQGRLHDYSNNIDISIDDSYISSSDGRGRVVMRSGRLFFTESSLWDESREPYLVIQNGINGMIGDGASINARKSISITNSSSTGFSPVFDIGQFGFSGFYVGQNSDKWIPTVVGGQNRGVYICGGLPYGPYVSTTPSILVGCDSQGQMLCDSGWRDGTRIYLRGNFVHIPSAQYQTTSAGANVHVADDGALVRSTSAAKYKTNIVDATGFNYGDKLINLTPKLWLDKAEQKRYQDDPENNPRPNFYYGLIADELSKEGLSKLVVYNSEGEVEGINYDRIAVALLPVIKKLKDKIKILEEKINE